MSKKGGSKFYTDESTGFKIQPKTVLIMSLVYIGIVVLLHIYSKIGGSPKGDIETPKTAQEST